MELSNYTIQELVELKNDIESLIETKKDGFIYIINVRSYGRVSDRKSNNMFKAMEICDQYTGDDGIATLYTNNPDINFRVYGGVFKINSVEEYNDWVKYVFLKHFVSEIGEQIKNYDNRENMPFLSRPMLKPMWSKEELEENIQELNELEKSVVIPISLGLSFYGEEEEE